MIYVHKPILPDRELLDSYIDKIYDSAWLTNNGPLVQLLEKKLSELVGCKHVILVSSGTSALEVALQTLSGKGEVITTPFSFAATSQAISYTGRKVSFSDINEKTFNLCPKQVERKITSETAAILPVHVYGNPCDLSSFSMLGDKYNIPIIYDAAHCFGVQINNNSVFKSGNISVTSFHATKLFHTIEGGAIFTEDDKTAERARKIINFGLHEDGSIKGPGTNAKMNEFEAAMGLALLPKLNDIIDARRKVWHVYFKSLSKLVGFQEWHEGASKNYAYFPILLKSEEEVFRVLLALKSINVVPRRYFYPTLSSIYQEPESHYAEEVSSKVICLPIYPELDLSIAKKIASKIISELNR